MTVALVAGAFLLWRDQPQSPAPVVVRDPRGGQMVASLPSAPLSFNPWAALDPGTQLVSLLTQARLVRINRSTLELEPWLAERWEASPDGRVYTLHLAAGVMWSDGVPLTADDVVFSVRAVLNPQSKSPVAAALKVGGQPIRATAPDPSTVILTYPAPWGPGLRLLDSLVILPRHKLESLLKRETVVSAWGPHASPSDIVGAGPFVFREYEPGRRLTFDRNPRYFRRTPDGDPLPYLDRIVLEVVSEQSTELERLQAGQLDLAAEALPSDAGRASPTELQERVRLIELGVSPEADAFWFCLKAEVRKSDPRFAFVQKSEFRQALSHAVDRETLADQVYRRLAVPVWGPVTPGNRAWFWPDVPRYRHDLERARALLTGIGLEDRNGDGVVEDEQGTEARFELITEGGNGAYARGAALIRDQLARIGVVFDVLPLDRRVVNERVASCDYDAVYDRPHTADLDPAGSLDMWLSSGASHFWNISQKAPATDWERRIDTLMLEQSATVEPNRRRELFDIVQRILAENQPAVFLVARRLYYAQSARVTGVEPSVLWPPALWNADTLGVASEPRSEP